MNSDKEAVRKEAVKKVIAAMTVGKDVSMLFSDVVKCVQTNNIELKKLVYLYIMYYAKSQPDLAILAVNTFDSVRNAATQNLFLLVNNFLLVFIIDIFNPINFKKKFTGL